MTHVLEARQVGKTYGSGSTEVEALSGVDLVVRSGELLVIMGPSGSGKSTLLHLLGGLEPPTTGQILIEGVEFGSLNDEQRSQMRRRRIGFVFQKINLLPTLNSLENVSLPLLIDGVDQKSAEARARDALEAVGMLGRAHHLPSAMSGGEQQRVAISRALVINPAVILADEPTGALDRANGQNILQLLRTCVSQGQTVVLVTHDAEIAAQADRNVVVRDGRLQDSPERKTPHAQTLRRVTHT